MNKMIELIIDDEKIIIEEGKTILEAARKANIYIPSLCYHPSQTIKANCRLCLIEIEGYSKLVTSCSTKAEPNMVVRTNSDSVKKARKITLELLLSNHDFNCSICSREDNCELKKVVDKEGINDSRFLSFFTKKPIDNTNPSIIRDINKCIKCGRCIEVCKNVQGLNILEEMSRSHKMMVGIPRGKYLSDILCTFCGQCSSVCPVAAITEKDDINKVWLAINNPVKHVIVQVAPAVRVSIGEMFGLEAGHNVTGKIVTSLRRLGFNNVYDTNFAADLTIVEESYELFKRVKEGGVLPMITSCSPGWINYIEQYHPELLEHVSSCKSPQQMFGAIAKTYYSEQLKRKPENIFVVSIMPCTAKKYEASREEMKSDGVNPDIDAVLTTREFAKMIKQSQIDFLNLEDGNFDDPFGFSTGAGTIFGNTGGVMEAALRTFYEMATGKALANIDFKDVRGLKGFKEAVIDLGDKKVKVAVVHSLLNAKKIINMLKENRADYAFIEVMCCEGGCIGGGGQPYNNQVDVKQKRIDALYHLDEAKEIRKSHQNPFIEKLYKEFLIEPHSDIAKKLLHTTYNDRKNKPEV